MAKLFSPLVAFLFCTALSLVPHHVAAQSQTGEAKVEYISGPHGVDLKRPEFPLKLSAKLLEGGDNIQHGLIWRVFREAATAEGKQPLVAVARGGDAVFSLNAGSYLVHAGFGRASASKRVLLASTSLEEEFVLNAGGLELYATVSGKQIPIRDLRFSIYELEQDEDGIRKLIALNAGAGKIVQLNAGTYHVFSRYGQINATVRADLEVKAGKVTKATLQHRGAKINLRLVSQIGGSPVANTAWSVFTEDGEKVFESQTVAPSLILSEGTYEAAVRNGENAFRKSFTVQPGQNARVEILLK